MEIATAHPIVLENIIRYLYVFSEESTFDIFKKLYKEK